MKTLPLRLTILHLAQRFRIDGETFISKFSLHTGCFSINSQEYNYILSFFFRPDYAQHRDGFMGQSGEEVLLR